MGGHVAATCDEQDTLMTAKFNSVDFRNTQHHFPSSIHFRSSKHQGSHLTLQEDILVSTKHLEDDDDAAATSSNNMIESFNLQKNSKESDDRFDGKVGLEFLG